MQNSTLFVDVIVPLSVPNKYTYRVPKEFNSSIEIGKRVLVQFGKTKIYTGIIYKIHTVAPTHYQAKYIEAVLDDYPIVNELQLIFWDWIAFYYCANPGDVMNVALPSGLKLSSNSHIQINPQFNLEETELDFFTEKEHLILDNLLKNSNLSFDDVAKLLKLKSRQKTLSLDLKILDSKNLNSTLYSYFSAKLSHLIIVFSERLVLSMIMFLPIFLAEINIFSSNSVTMDSSL
jgi:primosomal protein N' (replication factor Y)